MRYVSDGIPEHEARLTFEGLGAPLYTFAELPKEFRPTTIVEEEPDIFKSSVDELDLPIRASNVCKRNNIKCIGDLVLYSKIEFGRLRNCGANTVAIVEEALKKLGLEFNQEPEMRKKPLPHTLK